jgi:hypothetical protein
MRHEMKNGSHISTKSSFASKINIAQVVGFVLMILAAFGVVVPPGMEAAAVAVIAGAVQVYTVIARTWFTTSITRASAARM